jgi:flagellar assembly factor FliW
MTINKSTGSNLLPKTKSKLTKNTKKNAIRTERERKLKSKLQDYGKRKQIKAKGYYVKSDDGSRYKTGLFYSKKNRKRFVFRSAYEFAYFHVLEADTNVVSYIVEPFKIKYRYNKATRNYIPDLLVLYKDGTIKILEIKPLKMVMLPQVQKKAAAARAFIKKNIKNGAFEFITEEDIFHTMEDYKALLGLIK